MNEQREEEKAVHEFRQFVKLLSATTAANCGMGGPGPEVVADTLIVSRQQMVDLFLKVKPTCLRFREQLFHVHKWRHNGYQVSRERWMDACIPFQEAHISM
jgi:hypothetical protein